MPHAEIRNSTDFAYVATVVSDEQAVPQYVSVVQAEYSFSASGTLELLEEQLAPSLGGEWYGDTSTSSIKLEPLFAFLKPATDIVLIGHAHAPHVGATTVQVGIMVGPVRKIARVTGDRRLVRRLGVSAMSAPEPFEKIPLIYERAFGGWDRTDEDPEKHSYEARNPVGTGFRRGASGADDEFAVPNVEDPEQPFRSYGDTPVPAGFGFIAANWQPRVTFAGTYDKKWNENRKPLLPEDFDRRFYNSASPGLIAPGYLVGDEPVALLGMTPEGRVGFHLPRVPPPVCTVHTRGRKRTELRMSLDTLIVDADRRVVSLQWRASLPLRDTPHEVVAVDVQSSPEA
jgi:hypothetical protein